MIIWLRRSYLAMLLLAAPAAFWTAFEMYGLTLRGPQMLFYSISHAYPVIFTVVYLSVPFFLLLALFNAALLASGRLRGRIAASVRITQLLLAFQTTHVILLVFYSTWAYSGIRVLVCILALLSLLAVAFISFIWAVGAQQGVPADRTRPAGESGG